MKKNYFNTSEIKRYQDAGQHIIRGASDFLLKFNAEIRRTVDVQLMKEKAFNQFNEVKTQLKEKFENIKNSVKSNVKSIIGKSLGILLISSVGLYAVIQYFGIDSVIENLNNFNKKFQVFKNNTINLFTKLRYIIGTEIYAIKNNLTVTIKEVGELVGNLISPLWKYINDFFNDYLYKGDKNVFEEIFLTTVNKAIEIALDESWFGIFKLLVDKTYHNVIQRPRLHFLLEKGGVDVDFYKFAQREQEKLISSFENFKGSRWGIIVDQKNRMFTKTYKVIKFVENDEDTRDQFVVDMGIIHAKSVNFLKQIVNENDFLNPYKKTKEIVNTDDFVELKAQILGVLSKEIHVTTYARGWSPHKHGEDIKQADLQYIVLTKTLEEKQEFGRFTELYKSLDDFEKKFSTDYDNVVGPLIDRWRSLKKDIKSGKKEHNFGWSTGLTANIITDMYILLLTFGLVEGQRKRRKLIFDPNSASNIRNNTRILGKIEKLNRTFKDDLMFDVKDTTDGIIDLDTIEYIVDEKIALWNDEIEKLEGTDEKRFYVNSLILRNLIRVDVFSGFDPFLVINKIKALRDELRKIKQILNGYKRENIYHFNDYSPSSDTIYQIDNKGQPLELDSSNKSQFENSTASIEKLAQRMQQKVIDEEITISNHRRKRKILIQILSNSFKKLKNTRDSYKQQSK